MIILNGHIWRANKGVGDPIPVITSGFTALVASFPRCILLFPCHLLDRFRMSVCLFVSIGLSSCILDCSFCVLFSVLYSYLVYNAWLSLTLHCSMYQDGIPVYLIVPRIIASTFFIYTVVYEYLS